MARRTSSDAGTGGSTTTAGQIFERILADIVRGTHGPGAKLPSERDLARTLGASRPTVREALRRLGEWGLIQVRRGSGVVVRPKRDWSLDVLPAYLRIGAFIEGPVVFAQVVRDLLGVRRGMYVEILRQVGPRLDGKNALASVREQVALAWSARADVAEFVRHDYEALRYLVEAAGFLPAVWLLGSLEPVYSEIARSFTGTSPAPADYQEIWNATCDDLDVGRVTEACAKMTDYLDRHDHKLLVVLGIEKETP
jgi:DNA-binding FadR family transcriptional regulator